MDNLWLQVTKLTKFHYVEHQYLSHKMCNCNTTYGHKTAEFKLLNLSFEQNKHES